MKVVTVISQNCKEDGRKESCLQQRLVKLETYRSRLWQWYGGTVTADKGHVITEQGESLAHRLVCSMDSLLLLILVGERKHVPVHA